MAKIDKKKIQVLINRRHPNYAIAKTHWDFLESTYIGGREWFTDNIFQYLKEGNSEYGQRVSRAYRFNHTRETVDLVNKYIFKAEVNRNDIDAPQEIKDFWKNSTLGGLDINQFMQVISKNTSILGTYWVFTDTNKDESILTKEDEKKAMVRPYAYLVKPQNIMDASFDENGNVNWVLVKETYRDDEDPFDSSGLVMPRYRLWTSSEWFLFEEGLDTRKQRTVSLVEQGVNALGKVPGFPAHHIIGDEKFVSPGLINDIAYLDRAAANYMSNLDAIIQDQTFSQLVIPTQSLPSTASGKDEDITEKMVEMGTKRIFTYDAEGGKGPEYISPDPSQAQIIIEVVNKIISEIYHSIGMAGERTKQDNAVGIDNSSGVAKAYDFERVNSLLVAKAASLENVENKLVNLILSWHSKEEPKEELIRYPKSFDVRSLYDEFSIAERLGLIDAPKELRREQMKQVIDKLFPRISAQLKIKLENELKTWLDLEEVNLSGQPAATFNVSKKNPQTNNRQGQVTATTK
jgi:hypothetical protein